jgi:hypothetical protein
MAPALYVIRPIRRVSLTGVLAIGACTGELLGMEGARGYDDAVRRRLWALGGHLGGHASPSTPPKDAGPGPSVLRAWRPPCPAAARNCGVMLRPVGGGR